jgi:hypothetical protein
MLVAASSLGMSLAIRSFLFRVGYTDPMLLVIFGAGASYDSAQAYRPRHQKDLSRFLTLNVGVLLSR